VLLKQLTRGKNREQIAAKKREKGQEKENGNGHGYGIEGWAQKKKDKVTSGGGGGFGGELLRKPRKNTQGVNTLQWDMRKQEKKGWLGSGKWETGGQTTVIGDEQKSGTVAMGPANKESITWGRGEKQGPLKKKRGTKIIRGRTPPR